MTEPTVRPTFSPTRPQNRFPHQKKKRAPPPGTGTTVAKHSLIHEPAKEAKHDVPTS